VGVITRSIPPHPNPLPPGERVGHSSPQQSWGVFWHILINGTEILSVSVWRSILYAEENPRFFLPSSKQMIIESIGFCKKIFNLTFLICLSLIKIPSVKTLPKLIPILTLLFDSP